MRTIPHTHPLTVGELRDILTGLPGGMLVTRAEALEIDDYGFRIVVQAPPPHPQAEPDPAPRRKHKADAATADVVEPETTARIEGGDV